MFAPLQAAPAGYGWALLQTTFALAFVCLLAVVMLRWLSQRGVGMPRRKGRLRVLDRANLDRRRAVLTVAVGERVLLVGVGDSGPPSLLMELDERAAAVWLDDDADASLGHDAVGGRDAVKASAAITAPPQRTTVLHRS